MIPLRGEAWFECFGCATEHPYGLRLDPRRSGDDEVTCDVAFDAKLCSYPGMVHGGIVATAADEVMANLVLITRGVLVFSTTLRTRFIQPVRTGADYRIVARITGTWPDGYRTHADVYGPDGNTVLTADGGYAQVRPAHVDEHFALDATARARLHVYLSHSNNAGDTDEPE